MTTRSELMELADKCQECVETDEGSIDHHLEHCQVCHDYGDKAEMFNQTLEIIQIMAAKSEEERRRILSDKMDRAINMTVDKRIVAVTGLLEGLTEVSEEEMLKVVRTRTHLVAGYPKEKRDLFLSTLREVSATWSDERKQIEQKAVKAATRDYSILKRMMVRSMFNKVLE